MQFRICFVRIYFYFFLCDNWTAVNFLIHKEKGDPCFRFAVQDHGLNRGGAAIFWKEGRVHANRAERETFHDFFR